MTKIKGKKNTVPHQMKKTGQKERDKDNRRGDHEVRVAKWQALSPWEQIEALDARFGKDQGATRQRKRLSAKIAEALTGSVVGKVVGIKDPEKADKVRIHKVKVQ